MGALEYGVAKCVATQISSTLNLFRINALQPLARRTLTSSVRVRILHPLPKKKTPETIGITWFQESFLLFHYAVSAIGIHLPNVERQCTERYEKGS